MTSLNSSVKLKASNEVVGLPYRALHGSGCHLRGQNCYAEITLGGPVGGSDKMLPQNSGLHKNLSRHNLTESMPETKVNQKGPPEPSRVFIYPADAVLVPVMQTSLARSCLKRYELFCNS